MKKYLFISSIVLLALVMVIAGCSSGNATTSSPAQQTTAAQTTTQPAAQTSTAATTAATTKPPATTSAAPTKVVPTGTIRIAQQTFSYESFDPIFYESFWGWMIYDPLLSWDAKGNIIGGVAESYTLSPDGKTWTFKIRKGIKFHNGDPLTASDVKFSIERFGVKDSTNPWSPYLSRNFASNDVIDEYTYVYRTINPEPPLVIPFAWTRILPEKYFKSVGQDGFRAAPIGSGPWKLAKFESKTSCTFDANTDYWGQVPAYAHVEELLVPEESTRIAMLKRGDVDIIGALSSDRLVELRDAGFKLQEVGSSTLQNYNFQGTWLTKGATGDKKVRQAMSYAINREELCNTFYKGLAKPGSRFYMDQNTYGWDPSWTPDPYDMNKVKALLAEADYANKYASQAPIKLICQEGPMADMMTALKGYWDTAGIKTEVVVSDTMTYSGLFFVRNDDPKGANVGDIVSWIYAGFFNSVYHCANMYTSKGIHSTSGDVQADALYDKATKELDPVKAKQYWTEFQNYAYDMWVSTGVCYQPSYWAVGPSLGAFGDQAWKSIWESYAGIAQKK